VGINRLFENIVDGHLVHWLKQRIALARPSLRARGHKEPSAEYDDASQDKDFTKSRFPYRV
jgi:hypothetical protein